MSPKRIAPLSALAFIVLNVLSGPVFGSGTNIPKLSSSGATTTAFYVAHHSDQVISAILLAISALFVVTFALACRELIPSESRMWPSLFVGGSLIAAAGDLVAAGNHIALATAAHDHLSPAAIQALNAFDTSVPQLAFGIGFGIMLLGAAATMIPLTGYLRRFGWIALPLGIACVGTLGEVIFPLVVLWMLVLSVMLYRRGAAGGPGRVIEGAMATA